MFLYTYCVLQGYNNECYWIYGTILAIFNDAKLLWFSVIFEQILGQIFQSNLHFWWLWNIPKLGISLEYMPSYSDYIHYPLYWCKIDRFATSCFTIFIIFVIFSRCLRKLITWPRIGLSIDGAIYFESTELPANRYIFDVTESRLGKDPNTE